MNESKLMHYVEAFGQRGWSYVLYCRRSGRGKPWSCNVAADGLKMANGTSFSRDRKQLYVVESIGKCVDVFEPSSTSPSELKRVRTIPTDGLGDNVYVHEDDSVWVGSHAKALTFLRYIGSPQTRTATSQLLVLRKPTASSFDEVLVTNGELLPASSTAVVHGKKILIGSVSAPGVLLCSDLV